LDQSVRDRDTTNVFDEQTVGHQLEEVTVIGAAGRGRSARLQLDRSDAVSDPNQVIRLSAEAIAFGCERCGLWKGATDVRVENVSRGEAGSRE
jgi:hypothetical protein